MSLAIASGVGPVSVYTAGQLIDFKGVFLDDQEPRQPIDPTIVEFGYAVSPAQNGTLGPWSFITYSGAVDLAPGIIARYAKGLYWAQVSSLGLPGWWTVGWSAPPGQGQTASPTWQVLVNAGTGP